ncbi:BrnT family toxin [Rhodophyticola sp. CCM32]|uniref:BrnT family toxin n=1 Tax=Rhodophyticola sp. CCM32 TaxID=2916397 RepID=UPI001EE56346|nr:BrnT family toxin [Rhodophyticola sp. CCM32]
MPIIWPTSWPAPLRVKAAQPQPINATVSGEDRFKVIGVVDEKVFTGVFTWQDERPRFISVRRSNKGEERAYYFVF